MFDELIQKIKELIPQARSNQQYYTSSVLAEAADAIEELLQKTQQLPRWIPVTERLPENDGCYLVAVKNDHKRRYSKTAWFSHDSWFARQDVTHWMPLPEPPKED